MVTWSAPGPPYISAHAYWVIYWPEVAVNLTYVIRRVADDVTQHYVYNLHTASLYNLRVHTLS